jgi:hypothetical protein
LIAALPTSVTVKPLRLEVDRKASAALLLRRVQWTRAVKLIAPAVDSDEVQQIEHVAHRDLGADSLEVEPRQMDAEGIGYVRRDNCFVQVADIPRAQKLLNRQLNISWTSLLNRIAKQANPARKPIFGQHSLDIDYYWSVEESEWASDILFRSAVDLKALYPRLIRHGMQTMGSADVMRFLGRQNLAAKLQR